MIPAFQGFIEFSLANQLSKFGLNPKDWSLKPVGPALYRIQSNWDDEISLIGRVTIKRNGGEQDRFPAVWKDIQFESF